MVDSIYRTRSLGIGVEGLPDQYADGVAAKVWEVYIGEQTDRTKHYKDFLVKLLKTNDCKLVLDAACGTGIDSIMLLQEGFRVTSVDASDKMLKYALKQRWNRRKEAAFDQWVIEEANWLTLVEDIHPPQGQSGFDAVVCLGNSFAHLPDFKGNQENQRQAIKNFHDMLKPGGCLIIDHRNYDYILDTGHTPSKNIYYNSKNIKGIQTSILHVDNRPSMVTLDYTIDIEDYVNRSDSTDSAHSKKGRYHGLTMHNFRLSYYPHRLETFSDLLKDIFGKDCDHTVYGDFQDIKSVQNPAFYIHIVKKKKKV